MHSFQPLPCVQAIPTAHIPCPVLSAQPKLLTQGSSHAMLFRKSALGYNRAPCFVDPHPLPHLQCCRRPRLPKHQKTKMHKAWSLPLWGGCSQRRKTNGSLAKFSALKSHCDRVSSRGKVDGDSQRSRGASKLRQLSAHVAPKQPRPTLSTEGCIQPGRPWRLVE